MKVLLVCADPGIPVFGPSGAASHIRGLVHGLLDAGHTPHVLAFTSVDHRGRVAELPCAVETLDPPRLRSWRREVQEVVLSRRLRARADLVWERLSPFSISGGTPRILEINAPMTVERKGIRLYRLARWLERRSIRSADTVITVSRWLQRWATARSNRPVHWVPNGTACIRPGKRTATQGLIIGFVGHLRPWHAIDRFTTLLDALPEARLVIAGTGVAPEHARITHLGHVPARDLPDVVASFDVGLVPFGDGAPWRGPLKVFDYLAQGVPVVAPDRGDLRALLGDSAIVDDDDWASVIRRRAQDPRSPRIRSWKTVVKHVLSLHADGLSVGDPELFDPHAPEPLVEAL